MISQTQYSVEIYRKISDREIRGNNMLDSWTGLIFLKLLLQIMTLIIIISSRPTIIITEAVLVHHMDGIFVLFN